VLPVLGAGDHGEAGVHGAALGGVHGDCVAELGVGEVGVHELAVRPAAPSCYSVGVECPADEESFCGDGVDAEQVAVGQGAARLPRLDGVVVAGTDDQVAGAGRGAVGDRCRGSFVD
jgi:hypothetical protein